MRIGSLDVFSAIRLRIVGAPARKVDLFSPRPASDSAARTGSGGSEGMSPQVHMAEGTERVRKRRVRTWYGPPPSVTTALWKRPASRDYWYGLGSANTLGPGFESQG